MKHDLLSLPEGQLRLLIAITACRMYAGRLPTHSEALRLGIDRSQYAFLALIRKGWIDCPFNADMNPVRLAAKPSAMAWGELERLSIVVPVRVEVAS